MKSTDKKNRWFFIALFLLLPIMGSAQKGLRIDLLFEECGKQEGSILIELGKDVLRGKSRICFYKGLIINSSLLEPGAVEEALKRDTEKGSIISESKKDGQLKSAYYSLGKNEKTGEYEYILYTLRSKKITLVYLRGDFPPRQLKKELDKLKNLIIKIDNKQIDLQ